MKNDRRAFLIVLDSFGIGYLPDAEKFGDIGADTLRSCFETGELNIPVMRSMGLFNTEGTGFGGKTDTPSAAFGRIAERSAGKDTTIGHWEIAGVVSEDPLPVYPEGFPDEVVSELEKVTGRKMICNRPYSGTKVILDYGREHIQTGALILYTSADSVCQIAAHEDVVPVEQLYDYCKKARDVLKGKHGVGRVIARPFTGQYPEFARTSGRHDFSLEPPEEILTDRLSAEGYDTPAVGKIYDIFAGRGITEMVRTSGNAEGMMRTDEYTVKDFSGLCFVNLVDFDMLYGHRRDPHGYTAALNEFDIWLGKFIKTLRENDILIITADHGCDPCFKGTDHTREYTPLLVYGRKITPCDLGTLDSFSVIAASLAEYFGVDYTAYGKSFLSEVMNLQG